MKTDNDLAQGHNDLPQCGNKICLNVAIRHLVALSESKDSDGIGIEKKSQDPLVLSTTQIYVNQT